ncbi:unnamed protein product, partial [Ectocarpus sp. 12 AP-2014]
VCTPCVSEAANDNYFVRLPDDERLRSPAHVNGIALRLKAQNIPSRQIPTAIADELFGFKGAMQNHLGKPFVVGAVDIDNSFAPPHRHVGEHDDQDLEWTPDFKWIRDLIKRARVPGKQTAQMRVTPRLRLLELYLQIVELKREDQK